MARIGSSTVSSLSPVPGKGVPPEATSTEKGGNFADHDPRRKLAEKAYNHAHALQAALCGKGTIGWTDKDVTQLFASGPTVIKSCKEAAIAAGVEEDEADRIWNEQSRKGAEDCTRFVVQAKLEADQKSRDAQRELQAERTKQLEAQAMQAQQKRTAAIARRHARQAQGTSTKGKGSKQPRSGQTITT